MYGLNQQDCNEYASQKSKGIIYKVVKEIGKGSQGRVRLCQIVDSKKNKVKGLCALKIIEQLDGFDCSSNET